MEKNNANNCSMPNSYVCFILQYKFIVDGDCRHDEQQPVVTPTFGTVNNVLLVPGPELLPTAVSPEPLGLRANMEVDHDVFQRVVSTRKHGNLKVQQFMEI
jgi:hypothetical protein